MVPRVLGAAQNPAALRPEVLSLFWVGPEAQASGLLERLINRESVCLVGPRGSGKTHLLWLVYDAFERSGVSSRVVCLDFEGRGASLAALWLQLLSALAAPAERLSALSQGYTQRPAAMTEAAEALLFEFIGEEPLLLFIEGLDDLLEALGAEGQQRFLAVLRARPSWTIAATSASGRLGPLAERVQVHTPPRLEASGALELLRRRGGSALRALLGTSEGQARQRAFYELLGGSPRVNVALAGVLGAEPAEALLGLLDAVAPQEYSALRELAPLQRRLLFLLSRAARPITVKQAAEGCFTSHQSTAKQLGELVLLGLVRKASVGRESYCELAEPLLRGCLAFLEGRVEPFLESFIFLLQWHQAEAAGEASVPLFSQALLEVSSREGLRALLSALLSSSAPEGERQLSSSLTEAILLTSLTRGPAAAAPFAVGLLEVFSSKGREVLLGAIFSALARRLLLEGRLGVEAWEPALLSLEGAFSGVEGCSAPIQFMRVANRYLRKAEATTLLMLPIEQRALLARSSLQ